MANLMTGEEQNASGSEETTETSEETTETTEEQTTETDESTESTTETGEQETKEGKVEGAPEKYEDFTLPEGMAMDAEALEAYAPVLKDLNLTQDQAQKLVDLQAAQIQKSNQAILDHITERDEGWLKDLEADKEIGGDKLNSNMVKVNKMLSKFDEGGELVKFLQETRIQNCAPLVKLLARMAPHFGEDTLVTGSEKTKSEKPAYMRMGYKSLNDY